MRRRWTAVRSVLLGCVAFAKLLPAQASGEGALLKTASEAALPKLEPASGPYGVGRLGYHWIDSKRPNRFVTDSQMHREVMVYLWYPASLRRNAVKAPYLPWAKDIDAVPELQRRMRGEFNRHWPSIVSGTFVSAASESAPAAPQPARLPVVLFSHGNGSTIFNYASLIEDLASHGYLVAAIEHPQTCAAVRFPDGRIVPFQEPAMPRELSRDERLQYMMNSASISIAEGADDMRFVTARLAELNNAGSRRFPLAGRLALNRVAAMGHSAGGAFATRACQLDPSLAACVNLDGGMPPVATLPVFPDGAVAKQPLLLLEPRDSNMFGTKEEIQEYLRTKARQLQSLARGSYHVTLKAPGMAHPSFSDTPIFYAGEQGFPPIDAARYNHRLIRSYTRVFLDKTLKGQRTSLLDDSARPDPEAAVQPYGR